MQDGAARRSQASSPGDFVNHAIFMPDELDGGLNRLLAAGLVEARSRGFGLTADGRAIHRDASAADESMHAVLDRLAAALATRGLPARVPRATTVSQTDFDRAYALYAGPWWRRLVRR